MKKTAVSAKKEELNKGIIDGIVAALAIYTFSCIEVTLKVVLVY